MRIPLRDGLPTSGDVELLVPTELFEKAGALPRYVTLLGANTRRDIAQSVTVVLRHQAAEVMRTELALPPLDTLSPPAVLLSRFPVRWDVSLSIEAPPDVMVSGFVEETPLELVGALEPFVTEVSPFELGTGLVKSLLTCPPTGEAVQLVHQLIGSGMQEVSLAVEVAVGARLFLGIEADRADGSVDRCEFSFRGPLVAYPILDRVPLRFEGRITAQASRADAAFVWGATTRR